MAEEKRACPDGGVCHHECEQRGDGCFRVAFCGPLSNVYPGDTWPDTVRDIEAARSRPPQA